MATSLGRGEYLATKSSMLLASDARPSYSNRVLRVCLLVSMDIRLPLAVCLNEINGVCRYCSLKCSGTLKDIQ